ncbi:MAG: hypothetical protein JW908_09280 [Anaerolineales bacterium]|nr:hypothetical protein [Anaerolineales bacterium]
MNVNVSEEPSQEHIVSIDEVNRILEVGRLLLSTLSQEEKNHLERTVNNTPLQEWVENPILSETRIGNTSVT